MAIRKRRPLSGQEDTARKADREIVSHRREMEIAFVRAEMPPFSL